MRRATVCAVLIFGSLIAGAIAVHPDYVLASLAGPLTSAPRKDSGEGAEQAALATPRHCCKLGERAGFRGLPCGLELHVTSRTENMVFKQKRKHHDQESEPWRRTTALAFDAARCTGHKKLFEKCCAHRARNRWRSGAEGDD